MSAAKPTWDEVKAWANAEVEAGRLKLETATAAELPAIQARVAVMRELMNLTELPAAAAMPPAVPYA